MDHSSPYSLFGLDLSQYVARVLLGWQQLLWGDEVGLRDRFCPPVRFINQQSPDQSNADGVALASDSSSAPCLAWLIPESEVLIREVTLPIDAETFLHEAVISTVQSHSPFDFAETSFGFRIALRSRTALTIRVAMVLRATAEEQAREAATEINGAAQPVELWAEDGLRAIMLLGFGEASRARRYYANLARFAVRTAAAIAGMALILTFPAFWVSQHAGQLAKHKSEVQARVGSIVAVRERLVRSQELNEAARSFFSAYVDYGPWLHKISSLTPDQVFFQRLGLEGLTLTLSGMAENAADYQSILAEAGIFSELAAPSAFIRDERAGRERFTLSMNLSSESAE